MNFNELCEKLIDLPVGTEISISGDKDKLYVSDVSDRKDFVNKALNWECVGEDSLFVLTTGNMDRQFKIKK